MNGVVDGVVVELLGTGGDTLLVSACVGLRVHSLLKVGLGVPYYLAEQLCELCGVVGLLIGDAAVSLGDLGIAFPVSLAAHGYVHSYFGAFSGKVGLKSFPYFLVASFGYSECVTVSP